MISRKRQGILLSRYSDSPERKYRREIITSVQLFPSTPALSLATGSLALFSSTSVTSAMPRGGFPSLPANTTSLISWPRKCLGLCSPSTHRSASTMLDLPQPLGPRIAVIPAGKLKTVLSLKDLKPSSSSCLIRICPTMPPIPHTTPLPVGKCLRDATKKSCEHHILRYKRKLALKQFGVPVGSIDRVQVGQPLLVTLEAERLQHEWCPLWSERLADQMHAGFLGEPPPLEAVTGEA